MTLEDFYFLVGNTIMYAQTIEHDIKSIYELMDDDENASIKMQGLTLGQAICSLKRLDGRDGAYYFTKEDYDLLFSITKKRNHWVHEAFLSFMYENDPLNSEGYLNECSMLKDDNKMLTFLSKRIEEIKLDLLKLKAKE